MTLFTDYAGRAVRLTDERRRHLLSHPEMVAIEPLLERAIVSPERVVRSVSDDTVAALLSRCRDPRVRGEAALCRHQAPAVGFFRDHGLPHG